MHRTRGTNYAAGNLFTDGPPGTCVEENWLNAVQEEIAYAVEQSGQVLLTPADDTHEQLWEAIQLGAGRTRVMKPNLVFNPTAMRGNDWWYGGGSAGDYAVGETDPVMRYSVATWTARPDDDTYGWRGYWWIVPAAGWVADAGEKISILEAKTLTLSFDYILQGPSVTGECGVFLACYDATNLYLGSIGAVTLDASDAAGNWTMKYASGETPLNTSYVRVVRYTDGTLTATAFYIRAIKVERIGVGENALPTKYEDTLAQHKINFKAYMNSNISMSPGSIVRVDFSLIDWQVPSQSNLTLGTGTWKFSAPRFMRLCVNMHGAFATSLVSTFMSAGDCVVACYWTQGSGATTNSVEYGHAYFAYEPTSGRNNFECTFDHSWFVTLDASDIFFINVRQTLGITTNSLFGAARIEVVEV